MIELFTSNTKTSLHTIGDNFARIVNTRAVGPFDISYVGITEVSKLKKQNHLKHYNSYVDLAVVSGKKYGIQLDCKIVD